MKKAPPPSPQHDDGVANAADDDIIILFQPSSPIKIEAKIEEIEWVLL
jgi:hypothetical protein